MDSVLHFNRRQNGFDRLGCARFAVTERSVKCHPHGVGLKSVQSDTLAIAPIAVGDVATGSESAPHALLPAFRQALDDVLPGLFSADLAQHHVLTISAVVCRHVGDEDAHAELLEFIGEALSAGSLEEVSATLADSQLRRFALRPCCYITSAPLCGEAPCALHA
jgi:hypothetical protein